MLYHVSVRLCHLLRHGLRLHEAGYFLLHVLHLQQGGNEVIKVSALIVAGRRDPGNKHTKVSAVSRLLSDASLSLLLAVRRVSML